VGEGCARGCERRDEPNDQREWNRDPSDSPDAAHDAGRVRACDRGDGVNREPLGERARGAEPTRASCDRGADEPSRAESGRGCRGTGTHGQLNGGVVRYPRAVSPVDGRGHLGPLRTDVGGAMRSLRGCLGSLIVVMLGATNVAAKQPVEDCTVRYDVNGGGVASPDLWTLPTTPAPDGASP